MSVESFLRALELPVNADIEPVEKKFLEHVKDRIQAAQVSYDEQSVQVEEQWMRDFHRDFFDFAIEWTKREMQKNADQVNHPEAAAFKKQARDMLAELQTNIIEFSLCYMHINRFITLLRDEIKSEEIKMGINVTNMKWSSDVGNAIAKYRKQKKMLVQDTESLMQARTVLEGAEKHFTLINKTTQNLFGADKAAPLTRSMISGLRTSDAMKVRKMLCALKDTKKKFSIDQKTYSASLANIERAVESLQKTLTEHKDRISDIDGKLYLKPIEVDLAYNGKIAELRKIKGFLAKYHLPYMQHKLDSLARLREKTLVIGSMESLMTLYKKMLSGLAQPLTSLEDIRNFENDVVNQVKYLMSGHFQEIPNIRRDAENVVQEFRDGRKEFEEMQNLELNTIEGVGE